MILAPIETEHNAINELSLQALTVARKLARVLDCSLEATLIAADIDSVQGQLGDYGVSKVHIIDHEHLESYAPDAWASSLEQLIETTQPEAVIASGTQRGNEVLARLAARTNLPLAANCTEIAPGDSYTITRIRWGGTLLEEATLSGNPKLMTVAPHVIDPKQADTKSDPGASIFTPKLDKKDLRVRVKQYVHKEKGVALGTASVVVGGGRGVGSSEGFAVLEELAQALGGVVGASRVATNEGWRSHSDQIGQTGTRIAPEIYIACGISGATQHIVGCAGAKNILVINTDPEAPIISKAEYAIIGDLHEVVPALTEKVKASK